MGRQSARLDTEVPASSGHRPPPSPPLLPPRLLHSPSSPTLPQVRVPLPDQPARLAVLRASLRRCPLAADVDLPALAGQPSEGMSGADLAEVCRRAGMAAIRELVAAERAWAAAAAAADAGAASGSAGAAAGPPEAAPLQQRHLEAALGGVRRSVSAEESQRHARIEQQLTQGSLSAQAAAPGGQRAAAATAALQQAVRTAVSGSVERRMAALQQRVKQLEEFACAAGLQLPPPAAALPTAQA